MLADERVPTSLNTRRDVARAFGSRPSAAGDRRDHEGKVRGLREPDYAPVLGPGGVPGGVEPSTTGRMARNRIGALHGFKQRRNDGSTRGADPAHVKRRVLAGPGRVGIADLALETGDRRLCHELTVQPPSRPLSAGSRSNRGHGACQVVLPSSYARSLSTSPGDSGSTADVTVTGQRDTRPVVKGGAKDAVSTPWTRRRRRSVTPCGQGLRCGTSRPTEWPRTQEPRRNGGYRSVTRIRA
jgi:hypothetical protein